MLVNNQSKEELFQDKVYETDSYKSHSSESKGISSSGENTSQKTHEKSKDVFSTEELKGEKIIELESKYEDSPDLLEEGEHDGNLFSSYRYQRDGFGNYSEKDIDNPRILFVETRDFKEENWKALGKSLERKDCSIRNLDLESDQALQILGITEALAKNRSLHRITISPQNLPNKVLEKLMLAITKCQNLRTLEVFETKFIKGNVKALLTAIQNKDFPISHLRLWVKESDLEGIRDLISAIKQQPRIRYVETRKYNIYKKMDDGRLQINTKKKAEFAEFAKLLQGEHPIDQIRIAFTAIPDWQEKHMAPQVHKCTDPLIRAALACKNLTLFAIPGMGKKHCRALVDKISDPHCKLLHLNMRLTHWNLGSEYNNANLKKVLRAVQKNTSILSLSLVCCMKARDCGTEIRNLLILNSSLRFLNLGNDPVPEQYALIAEGIRRNTGLRELCLGRERFEISHAKMIAEAVMKNPTLAKVSFHLEGRASAESLDYYLHEAYQNPKRYLSFHVEEGALCKMKYKRLGMGEKDLQKKSPTHFFRQIFNIHYNKTLSPIAKDKRIRSILKTYPKQYSNPDICIYHVQLPDYFINHTMTAPIDIAFVRGFRFREIWDNIHLNLPASPDIFPKAFAMLKISKKEKEKLRDISSLNTALVMHDQTQARRVLQAKLDKLEKEPSSGGKGCIIC